VIEAFEPPNRFAFRWQFHADNLPMTRVEFTLGISNVCADHAARISVHLLAGAGVQH
jgi:hypothetical protein